MSCLCHDRKVETSKRTPVSPVHPPTHVCPLAYTEAHLPSFSLLSRENRENRSSRPPVSLIASLPGNRLPRLLRPRQIFAKTFCCLCFSLSLRTTCFDVVKRRLKRKAIKRIVVTRVSEKLHFIEFVSCAFLSSCPFQLSPSLSPCPSSPSFRTDLKVDRHALRSRGQKWERRKGGKEKRRSEEVRSG